MCCIVSATGQSLPPVFIFPRKNYKDQMINGAPEGSLGLANPSGWMNSDNFLKVITHFAAHTRPSKEHPVVLIMDNHESHISYNVLEVAKQYDIHILTLPPHTSNITQPLDRSVFAPTKAAYSRFTDAWMLQNPGRHVTIYEVASLGGTAFMHAATPANICSGFKASGIWPLDREVFNVEEYLPSDLTDRPMPNTTTASDSPSTAADSPSTAAGSSTTAAGSSTTAAGSSTTAADLSTSPGHVDVSASTFLVSPIHLRGYPKAPSRKMTNRGRKRGKSMIATSTPEMKRIKDSAQKAAPKAKDSVTKKLFDDDSDSDISITDVLNNDREEENADTHSNCLELTSVFNVKVDDYIVCEFTTKSTTFYYVGVVTKERDVDDDVEVDFYRRKGQSSSPHFVKPSVQDVASVHIDSIRAILPPPIFRGTTARTRGEIYFEVDFSQINLR